MIFTFARAKRLGGWAVVIAALAACVRAPGYAQADGGAAVAIEVESVPAFGAKTGSITGRVRNVNPAEARVAALVFVPGLGAFSKPFCNQTTSPLDAQGRFSISIVTGGVDHLATKIMLVTVAADASVPCYSAEPGIPLELEQQSLAILVVDRPDPAERRIPFAGQSWVVKKNEEARVGPGPNYFSDSEENVFVDGQGRLHLRIVQRGNRWETAEVISSMAVGPGTYEFELEPVAGLDSQVVFGAFSWADAQRINGEVDFLEIGFGKANGNSQYVVQPHDEPGHLHRFTLPSGAGTVHKAVWTPSGVQFSSAASSGELIEEWEFLGDVTLPPEGTMNLRFNLWLAQGRSPRGDGELEVVIRDARFTPLSQMALQPRVDSVLEAAEFRAWTSPGGLATVFGRGFTLGTNVAKDVPLPRQLGGARVLVNGQEAPILFVSWGQVNFQLPSATPLGVARLAVEGGGARSDEFPFEVRARTPAFFRFADGMCIAQKPDATLVDGGNPAVPGETVTLYLTGIGAVIPAVADGHAAPLSPLSEPVDPEQFAFTLQGRLVQVQFLGLAPEFVALGQANLVIPTVDASGLAELTVAALGEPSGMCRLAVAADATAPRIELTHIPPWGSFENLEGRVYNVEPEKYRVAVLIRVRGAWWTKPFANSPLTVIQPEGTWVTDITTGGVDHEAGWIAVFLTPDTFQAPVALGQSPIPPEIEQAALANVLVERTRPPPPPAVVSEQILSTFHGDLEGWSDAKIRFAGRTGHPPGAIAFQEAAGDGSEFAAAPAKYLGDWSPFDGRGFLSYEWHTSRDLFSVLGGPQAPEVRLSGPGGAATWRGPLPAFDWRSCDERLRLGYRGLERPRQKLRG